MKNIILVYSKDLNTAKKYSKDFIKQAGSNYISLFFTDAKKMSKFLEETENTQKYYLFNCDYEIEGKLDISHIMTNEAFSKIKKQAVLNPYLEKSYESKNNLMFINPNKLNNEKVNDIFIEFINNSKKNLNNKVQNKFER